MSVFAHSPHCAVICAEVLRTCDAGDLIASRIHYHDYKITCDTVVNSLVVTLCDNDRIHVLGAGKAAATMAAGLEKIFGEMIEGGIVATKYGHGALLKKIRIIEAAHPVPDVESERAGRALAQYAQSLGENDVVLFVVSGGASACCVYPYQDEISGTVITLDEKITLSNLLLASGACIDEVNTVRKHFSSIKAGRMAQLLYPARTLTLIISDVAGDRLDTIASGMTMPDTTTFLDVHEICTRYALYEKLPGSIYTFVTESIEKGLHETPKPGDEIFNTVFTAVLASNKCALQAAKTSAMRLGYHVEIVDSCTTGEASEKGKSVYIHIRERTENISEPWCFLWGGETTVTIKGQGKGGRNQEAALAFIHEARNDDNMLKGIHALFLATDGSDGPTDAAGAVVSEVVMRRIFHSHENPRIYLDDNNAYPFLDKYGALLRTGPTGTNVCDVWVVLCNAPNT